jgi:outer membrane scaffolding protein for murein synthesis (MipA/OmpV family)
VAITTAAGLIWANDNHMDSFFGVTPSQSAGSGLPAYEADAGFKRVNLAAGLVFRLREQWMLKSNATLGYLTGDAADSPVVEKRLQPAFVLGIAHVF